MGSPTRRAFVVALLFSLFALAATVWFRRSVPKGTTAAGAEGAASSTLSAASAVGVARSTGELKGAVLDAQGHGILSHVVAKMESGSTEPAAGTTNARGEFDFAALPIGRYTVWAWSEQGDHAREALTIAAQVQTVTLRFSTSGELVSGVVLDASGGVVVGAEITAGSAAAGLDEAIGLAFSDARGGYRLRLPAGSYLLTARMAGYARSQAVIQVGQGGGAHDFRLLPAARISGLLHSSDRRPAASGTVSLRPSSASMVAQQTLAQREADAGGAFVFTEVQPGRYLLFASAGSQVAEVGPIQLAPGQQRNDVDITLEPSLSINGRLESSDGRAIAEATVTIQQDRDGIVSRRLELKSDSHGRFLGEGLSAQVTTLTVDHPNFLPAARDLGVLSRRSPEVRLVLATAARLRGRVQTSSGEAIAGAQVWATDEGPRGRSMGPAVSNEDGLFLIRLPQGSSRTTFALTARHERFGLGKAKGDASLDALIVLNEARFIEGQVRDENDAPVAYARVLATLGGAGSAGGDAFSVARSDGAFRLGPLSPGTISLRVDGAYAVSLSTDETKPSGRAVVQLSRTADTRGVILRVPARSARIEGRVLDSRGHPIDGVVVLASPARHGSASRREGAPALSGTDGKFSFDHIAPGQYQLFADAEGYARATVANVIAPSNNVEIRLVPPATIRGSTTDEHGAPSPGATLRIAAHPAGSWVADAQTRQSDGRGFWTLTDVTPGRYLVDATAADGIGRGQAEFVVDGESQEVKVVVAQGRTLSGRLVRFGDSAPLPGARIQVMTDHGGASGASVADGSFEVVGIPRDAEILHIRVEDDDLADDYRVAAAKSDERIEVGTLRLAAHTGNALPTALLLGLQVSASPTTLTIEDVTDGSPAEKAGFRAGMRVIQVQGRDVQGLGSSGFSELVSRSAPAVVSVSSDDDPAGAPRNLSLAPRH